MKINHFIIYHSILVAIVRVIWHFSYVGFEAGELKSLQILSIFTGSLIHYFILALIISKLILRNNKNILYFLFTISGFIFIFRFLLVFIHSRNQVVSATLLKVF